ncbi:TPA: energy-coupling factor transporter transmembrane protein EcfT [Streptococcus pyogenes]|nr:energy-coupling factor transporter transmembrane protein EcfT [Streptococcus pyogenes]
MTIKLDFRTKLFMTIILSYVMVLGNLQALIISVIPIVLLINTKHTRVAIIGMATLVFVYGADRFLMKLEYSPLVAILLILVMVVKKILPAFLMGKYTILTSNVGESIYSLKKMKCPDEIAIPLTVMVRFFYAARIDYSQIKKAMRLRGLTLKKLIKNPILLFEYRLVPLLMCLSKTADDLTVSAMTKGLAVNQKRTSISESRIGGIDCIFFVIMVWAIYLYIRGKYA